MIAVFALESDGGGAPGPDIEAGEEPDDLLGGAEFGERGGDK